MDLTLRIMVGIISVISFIIYVFAHVAVSAKSWSKIGLGILFASGFLGLAVSGALIASGENDFHRIILWGIGSSIFGAVSFFALWVQHGVIIPLMFSYIKMYLKKRENKE